MKLNEILDNLNSFEKNSFLKIIDKIISDQPEQAEEVEDILTGYSGDLKNMDSLNVSKVFNHIEKEFLEYINGEILNSTSQFDILCDIIYRDGNCIMKRDWLARLYEIELADFDKRLISFKENMKNNSSDINQWRKRDYRIYRSCLETAYQNDDLNNQERKITFDEETILSTLSEELALSLEEIKLIKYQIIPVEKLTIDDIVNDLKSLGVIFHSKKTNTIYVADEVVRILRKVRGKAVADKFFRRVLRLFRDPELNLICRKYQIDTKLSKVQKIKSIINNGVSFSSVLMEDVHKPGTTLTERKNFINSLSKGLNMASIVKGSKLEEKIDNLVLHFENIEKDDKVGISTDGYEKLLIDLAEGLPDLNGQLQEEFELQEESVLRCDYLIDYNIKPRDVLELISKADLKVFCLDKEINSRGNLVLNILEAYKDSENLYLENYENIGFRNISAIKENGLVVKEAKLGIKFEELTKKIFEKLGFNVDEKLRKELNTSKDKIDIIIKLDNTNLMLIECKTVKESGYNKFSSVSRQMKSYVQLARKNDYTVKKSILIAPEFSDEFVKDCGLEYELNLSLITASSLYNILKGFKLSKHKKFPLNLLMRDVVIQESRVLKAIER